MVIDGVETISHESRYSLVEPVFPTQSAFPRFPFKLEMASLNGVVIFALITLRIMSFMIDAVASE